MVILILAIIWKLLFLNNLISIIKFQVNKIYVLAKNDFAFKENQFFNFLDRINLFLIYYQSFTL